MQSCVAQKSAGLGEVEAGGCVGICAAQALAPADVVVALPTALVEPDDPQAASMTHAAMTTSVVMSLLALKLNAPVYNIGRNSSRLEPKFPAVARIFLVSWEPEAALCSGADHDSTYSGISLES
jgi:hypothetical protein